MNNCESTSSIDFGVTNFSEQANLEIQKLHIIRIDCIHLLIYHPSIHPFMYFQDIKHWEFLVTLFGDNLYGKCDCIILALRLFKICHPEIRTCRFFSLLYSQPWKRAWDRVDAQKNICWENQSVLQMVLVAENSIFFFLSYWPQVETSQKSKNISTV